MRPTHLPCSKPYSRQCSTISPSWFLLLVLFLSLLSSFFFPLSSFFFLLSSFFFLASFFWLLCNLKSYSIFFFLLSSYFLVTSSLIASSYCFVTWSLIASSYSLEVEEFWWRENGMGLLLPEGKTSGWCYKSLFYEFTTALSECRLTSFLLSLFHVSSYGSVWGRCLAILVFIVAFGTW